MAAPADLALPPDRFWAVVASRQDLDQAVAAAQANVRMEARVARSANGWFAVIAGPYAVAASGGRAFIEGLVKERGAPKDTYLTRGAKFEGLAWSAPPTGIVRSIAYDGEHDVTATEGDLTLTLSRKADGPDERHPTLSALYKGRKAFSMEIGGSGSEKPASHVDIVRLDPASPSPQVVFSYYTNGAHCCTVTRIATLGVDGAWGIVDAGPLDGDGFAFERREGDGYSHLVSADNAFLYAFDSYADSYAPIRIQRLVGATLVDATRDEGLRHRVLQDLFREEYFADMQGADARRKHGFLAGWVANSMLAGRGHEAWATILATYDHEESMFGPETCTSDVSLSKCPEAKKVKLPFPAGLRQFLVEHGYMGEPDAYPVPETARPMTARTSPDEPADADAPAQLRTCASATDTVRRLILQTFAGRGIAADEDVSAVTIADDATLDAYDGVLRKATCAVGYTIDLRAVIATLAERGDVARAATLGRLSKRSGGSVSHRVTFTVKPTATPGRQFVELLP